MLKFNLPKLQRKDIEAGVTFVNSPEIKDRLGQTLEEGDTVLYASSGDNAGNLFPAKILGIYTRHYPGRYDPLVTNIQIAVNRYGMARQSVDANDVIKIGVDTLDLINSRLEQAAAKLDK